MSTLLRTRRFHSNEVAEVTGATLRQLQSWDESKLVSPKVEEGMGRAGVVRAYTVQEVIRAGIIVTLISKGYSLKTLRPVVPLIQNEIRLVGDELWDGAKRFYLITDAISVLIGEDTKALVRHMATSRTQWTVVSISDFVRKISNGKARHSAV